VDRLEQGDDRRDAESESSCVGLFKFHCSYKENVVMHRGKENAPFVPIRFDFSKYKPFDRHAPRYILMFKYIVKLMYLEYSK
jgi:hypothetical protein